MADKTENSAAPKLIKVEMRCPYCGMIQTVRLSSCEMFGVIGRHDVVVCDTEHQNGCGERYVVNTCVEFIATSFAISDDPYQVERDPV